MARLRNIAEERKRELDSDPTLSEQIRKRIAEHEAGRATEARRWRDAVLEQAGIPRRMWADLESLQETPAVAATRAWLGGGKTFLVLEGGVGVGKTYAAADFAASPGGLFVKADALARLSAFDIEGWERIYRAPRLAIDDLGTERLDEKGWALGAILACIDRRYDDAARTVITTNLSLDAVRERYGKDGGRLFDRLREAAEWVQLAGTSMRKAQ
jgi:DNA replication protein DnaC